MKRARVEVRSGPSHPETVVREERVYVTLSSLATPGYVPDVRVCACGDIDAGRPATRSREEAVQLVERIARRLGEFGIVYHVGMLEAVVREMKSRPDLANDD